MRIIYSILFLIVGHVSIAQTFGATGLEVVGNYDPATSITGQWLKQGNSGKVVMVFPQTPNGITAATTLIQGMLLENEMSFEKPDIYNSVYGKDVSNNNNNRNPDTMHTSILKGNSKVNLAWIAKDDSMLQLLLGKNAYEVIVTNAYK